jgi:hypothetical protein
MEKTTTIYHVDGRTQTMEVNEASRLVGAGQVGAGKGWSFVKPPPLNWERSIPRYKATRDLQPAQRDRYRFEPPFEKIWDSDIWQYGERPVMRGEIIETKEWPHPSFSPLNYGAERVLEYFNSQMKSRLQHSPWRDGIRLENGLTGPIISDVRPPQMQAVDLRQPMDLRPVS